MYDTQEALYTKVEISLSCRNLKDMDIFSKSDPVGVLFQKLENSYCEMGRTEIIKNNLNPIFSKVFEVDYHFEERQLFKIELYDWDSNSTRLADHDFLGRYEFSLGELVSRGRLEGFLNDCPLLGGKPQTVILTCQELSTCKETLYLKMNGTNLDKKDFLGKSDPILQIFRCNNSINFTDARDFRKQNYNFTLVYESKPIMNTLNPSWPAFHIKINKLCLGDKERLIKIVCTDWNFNGKLDFIGDCYSCVSHLINIKGKCETLELINVKKLKKRNYQNSGTLRVSEAVLEVDHSFIDYISGGTDLSFTVAIDFTASNGRQDNPRSLHFIPQYNYQGTENQYERAIISVGSIIQDYDTMKMFPAFGFGARIPPRNEVSHCFPINFCSENPFCPGVQGLLSSYKSAIQTVILHGPTNFSPSIRNVQRIAQNYRDGSKYFVLLIITDGIITDLDDTISAIIDCSYLPMSIIIIGVGDEDFSTMDLLDCDNGHLKHGQKISQRDIVQFVPIRDFFCGPYKTINQSALSKAVLFELPDQLTSWMKHNRISPLPASKPKLVPTQPNRPPVHTNDAEHNTFNMHPGYPISNSPQLPIGYPVQSSAQTYRHSIPQPNFPAHGARVNQDYGLTSSSASPPTYDMINQPSSSPGYPSGYHQDRRFTTIGGINSEQPPPYYAPNENLPMKNQYPTRR